MFCTVQQQARWQHEGEPPWLGRSWPDSRLLRMSILPVRCEPCQRVFNPARWLDGKRFSLCAVKLWSSPRRVLVFKLRWAQRKKEHLKPPRITAFTLQLHPRVFVASFHNVTGPRSRVRLVPEFLISGEINSPRCSCAREAPQADLRSCLSSLQEFLQKAQVQTHILSPNYGGKGKHRKGPLWPSIYGSVVPRVQNHTMLLCC